MDAWLSILAVALVYIAAVMTPGPNFLATVKNSLACSRRTGTYTALGIAGGTVVHVTAGFVGVTAVVWRTAWLFNLVKIAGGIYLVYTGWKSLTAKSKPLEFGPANGATRLNDGAALRSGFFTCLSNPKSALFYLSLFTAVIPPTTPGWAQIVMAGLMITLSVTWYAAVAYLFSHPKVQGLYARWSRWTNYLVGGLFIALGIRLLAAR